jgi:hypothetical protein
VDLVCYPLVANPLGGQPLELNLFDARGDFLVPGINDATPHLAKKRETLQDFMAHTLDGLVVCRHFLDRVARPNDTVFEALVQSTVRGAVDRRLGAPGGPPFRLVLALTGCEWFFLPGSINAFSLACERRRQLDCIAVALDGEVNALAGEVRDRALVGLLRGLAAFLDEDPARAAALEVFVVVTSAFGFVLGNGAPNLDTYPAREGHVGQAATTLPRVLYFDGQGWKEDRMQLDLLHDAKDFEQWRPFQTLDPLIAAWLGQAPWLDEGREPSLFRLDEVLSALDQRG